MLRRNADFVVTGLDETESTLYLIGAAGSAPPEEIYAELGVPDDASPWLLEWIVLGGALVLDPDGANRHLLTIDTLQDGRLVGRSRWADYGVCAEGGAGLAFTSTRIIGHAVARGAQFLIATHTPILMACPDARLYELQGERIAPVEFDDVEHVSTLRAFWADPEAYLRRLRAP